MRAVHFVLYSMLGFLAAPAAAKPVYLDCTTSDGINAPSVFQITFDEEAGTMSVTYVTGAADKLQAVFTANEVVGSNMTLLSTVESTDQWRINRATGHLTHSTTMGVARYNLSEPPIIREGSCAVAKETPRQF